MGECEECGGIGLIEVLIDCPQSFSTDVGDQETKLIECENCQND